MLRPLIFFVNSLLVFLSNDLESALRSRIPRRREGVLWIYGDSNAVRFYKSIKRRHLCSLIFKRCNFTYNWVYNIQNSTIEKNEQDFLDIDHERVIQELKTVLYKPEMNDSKSVLVLNFGLHFVSSIHFTNYKKLINRTIDVLREMKEENGLFRRRFQGDVIWKSTSAINRDRLQNPYYQGRRFMTQQVGTYIDVIERCLSSVSTTCHSASIGHSRTF
jgi:hypothetical protein